MPTPEKLSSSFRPPLLDTERRARSETPNNSGRTGSLAEISTGGHARRVRWLPPSKPSQIVAHYASDADPTRQIGGFAELLAGC